MSLIQTMRYATGPKDHGADSAVHVEYAGPGTDAIRACLNLWHNRPLTPDQRTALVGLRKRMAEERR